MILKSYGLKELNLNLKKFFLFYGKNGGLKNEILDILVKDKNKISSYEEKEILDN
jgi:DNA polymerase-3 subunit delta